MHFKYSVNSRVFLKHSVRVLTSPIQCIPLSTFASSVFFFPFPLLPSLCQFLISAISFTFFTCLTFSIRFHHFPYFTLPSISFSFSFYISGVLYGFSFTYYQIVLFYSFIYVPFPCTVADEIRNFCIHFHIGFKFYKYYNVIYIYNI